MKIFLAGTSFLPAYGGPARSVSRLAVALEEQGAEVGLWSADGSVMETEFIPEGSKVRRLSGSASVALAAFGRPDVLHDNGLWLPHNHQLAVLAHQAGIPRMVSLRGMLEPWAMRHKRWKKQLAWWLYQKQDLVRAGALHVTAASEQVSARGLGLTNRVVEIPNGVDVAERALAPDAGLKPQAGGVRQALFLGRIHPVKGLPMLVEAWDRVRPQGWELLLAGPDEGGHLAEVKALVTSRGLEKVILFPGEMSGESKLKAFNSSELFFLPSYTENFGMAAGEALAHGVPVVATMGTPWSGLAGQGCGWWVETSVPGLESGIRTACSLNPNDLRAMGERGRDWMARQFGWEQVAERMKETYQSLI